LKELPGPSLLRNSVFGLCFTAVGLAAVWAALADARPRWRGPVVFGLAAILGVFFAVAANAQTAGWVYILLSMLLDSAALLGSLLVVRSCGYRLVRHRVPRTERPSGVVHDSGRLRDRQRVGEVE